MASHFNIHYYLLLVLTIFVSNTYFELLECKLIVNMYYFWSSSSVVFFIVIVISIIGNITGGLNRVELGHLLLNRCWGKWIPN